MIDETVHLANGELSLSQKLVKALILVLGCDALSRSSAPLAHPGHTAACIEMSSTERRDLQLPAST